MNGGQICIAADYVVVHESKKRELITSLKTSLTNFYGSDASKSPEFCRLVSTAHFRRIKGMLEGSGGVIEHGGETDEGGKFIAPSIVSGVDFTSPLMKEEVRYDNISACYMNKTVTRTPVISASKKKDIFILNH